MTASYQTRTLNIQNFTAQGSTAWLDRLRACLAEPPALSPSTINNSARAGRVLAIGQFPRQAGNIERAFAPGQFAGFARRSRAAAASPPY